MPNKSKKQVAATENIRKRYDKRPREFSNLDLAGVANYQPDINNNGGHQ